MPVSSTCQVTVTVTPASTCQVTVTVLAASGPPICTLTASATSITFCQTITLTWTTAGGATFAQIEPDVGPVNPAGGSITVHPTMPITYVLTVTNQFGSSICFVEILVANAPCAKGPSQLPSKGWFQDP